MEGIREQDLGFDLIDGDETIEYSLTEDALKIIRLLVPDGAQPTVKQMVTILLLWYGVQDGDRTLRWLTEKAIPLILAGYPAPAVAESHELH